MAEKTSALHAIYVIDGVQEEYTPAQLLDAVTEPEGRHSPAGPAEARVVDETLDPVCRVPALDPACLDAFLDAVCHAEKQVPAASADAYTRVRVAAALIDALWRNGHFRPGDLRLDASWRWNEAPVGARAAFYDSVRAAADYIDSLGLKFSAYRYARTTGASELVLRARIARDADEEDYSFVSEPFRSERPVLGARRACPAALAPDPQSWVVYIPFDTSEFRLGGSLFAQVLEAGGGASPQITDADYFLDCHEVVRELVEDGILLAGATVGEGGLLRTVRQMAAGAGLSLDLSDVMRAYQEQDVLRILFAEVPGAVIQISDADFDYLDAELLLQDVAFFPLGHPLPGTTDVRVRASAKSGIQTILESLMQNAEGED
jgi:Phosphoribosylformylglycinamidine (FGAM) synthase, synthetase domain